MTEEIVAEQIAVVEPQAPAQKYRNTKCRQCQVEFTPKTPNSKFCPQHTTALTEDQRKDEQLRRMNKSRAAAKARKSAESLKYAAKIEVPKADALELLGQRIQNRQVRDTCYQLALKCAAETGVYPNRFFFAHGYQKTLESQKQRKELFLVMDQERTIPSEVIHETDLYAIWDYSISWRETEIIFTDFIHMRRILKSDWYELGLMLGIPFEEKPHRAWANFLPQWNPEGLQPGYTLKDMRDWLMVQKSPTYPATTRDFLLQASRNTMKSTASLALATAIVLCCPSIRLLLVSETTKLSKDFIKAFRGIWERGSNPAYERFQNLFPEYCIEPGDGKASEFTSPMRSFVLPQETAEVASLEVSVAGRRADLQLFDDVISNLNTGNNDQRQKGLTTYYALTKLREGGAGITVTLGTPWVISPGGDEIGDLYFELMKNNDQDPEHPMAVLVQPAFILKPEAQNKLPERVLEIIEDDVEELTCPSRWTFRDLMKEARKSVSMFLSQNLCMYVESEDSKLKVQFEESVLRSHVRLPNAFDQPKYQLIETICAVDVAYSVSRYADFSAICVGKTYLNNETHRYFMVVAHMVMERLRPSELAGKIVDVRSTFSPSKVVIEKSGSWQNLSQEIDKVCLKRGLPKPYNIIWRATVGLNVKSKVARVKALETLLNADQLFLLHSTWTETLINQFIQFDGVKRSGSSDLSKDDGPDSAAMCAEASYFLRVVDDAPPTEEQIEMEQQLERQRLIRGTYDQVFGNGQQQFVSRYQPESPAEEQNKLFSTLGRFGMARRAA